MAFVLLRADASALTHHVDAAGSNPVPPYASWETAATSLNDAVSIAASGSVVVATDGVYGVTAPVAPGPGVRIESMNGPSSTVLRALEMTNVVHLAAANASLAGFTVEHGYARHGGGIFCADASVLVSNCVIRNNRAAYGGGVFIGKSRARILNCVIESNGAYNAGGAPISWPESGGGGVFVWDANALIADCVIRCNVASNAGEGGGVTFFHHEQTFDGNTSPVARAIMRDCVVSSNVSDYTGGGVACFGWNWDRPVTRLHVSVSNCVIEANGAQYGGGYYHAYWSTMPALWNCLIVRNRSASNGRAVRVFDTLYDGAYWARSTFVSATIADNHATNNYGAYISGSASYMLNCILWSNRELGSLRVDTNSWHGNYQEAEYCDIEGGYNGIGFLQTNNFNSPPLFDDFAVGDFSVSSNSPCVDAGDDLGMFLPDDLDETARPLDGNSDGITRFDVGAYEYMHPLADSDADGLRDANEVAIGTSPARADTDGDRMADGEEMFAATDALNSNSFIGVTSVEFTGGWARVTWTTIHGRGYLLQRASPVGGPWSDVSPAPVMELDETPAGTEWDVDQDPGSSPAYRVQVLP